MSAAGDAAATGSPSIVVDPFAFKLFTGEKAIFSMTVEAFEAELNTIFDSGAAPLVDGYAPFWSLPPLLPPALHAAFAVLGPSLAPQL